MFKRYKTSLLFFSFILMSCHAHSAGLKTYTYNQRDQVVSITVDSDLNNPITFTYDAAGNRTSKSHNGVLTEYKWSPRHKLVEVSRNGMWLTRYWYDYKGLMIIKHIRSVGKSTQQINYHYDDTHLIAETNVIGNVLVKYEWAQGQLIGETRDRNTYYYQKDAMGSIVAITAQDGGIIARFEYDAFGNIIATQGSHEGLFGYTGFYADDETGLYYAQQRFYDAELGAFISEDPLEGLSNDPPSQHRYNYAKANPTKYVDRDGRCSTVVNMLDATACDRFKEGFTNPQVLAETIREIKLEGAAAVGIAQAVGNIATGAVQTAKDIGGTYVEAATGGRLAKGSMLRLKGQVDAQIDFISHPIDTINTAINNHNEIVTLMEEAGDFEGAMMERSRFASTGLLSVVGGGFTGTFIKSKVTRRKIDPLNRNDAPPLQNTQTATLITENSTGPGVNLNTTPVVSKPFNRKEIIKGFQDHHIVSDKNSLTKNHELLELSGYDLQKRSNKIYLPTLEYLNPTRSIHKGRHLNSVSESLSILMDQVVEFGKQQGWSKEQFRQALDGIIAQERHLLRTGERALNKNKRDDAKW